MLFNDRVAMNPSLSYPFLTGMFYRQDLLKENSREMKTIGSFVVPYERYANFSFCFQFLLFSEE